jgi:FkbM family methyltransferase
VGANLGQYVFFAKMLVKEENIIAFEPHPTLCSRLKEKYRDVTAFECALSDKQEVAQFKIPLFSQKEVHSRGKLDLAFNELEETDSRKIEVQVDTLDSVLGVWNRNNIDLIKIDVEGAEFSVLRGAVNTIKAHRPFLIVEIEQRHHKDPVMDKIREFEVQNAYEAFYIDSEVRRLIRVSGDIEIDKIQDVSRHGSKRLYINNFIFIPVEENERHFVDDVSRRIARD